MEGLMRRTGTWCLVLLLTFQLGCEYVRPTLNAPLRQWVPNGGYRFIGLAPPEAENSDSMLIVAAFSGGGTRASTLAFGVLRELAHQEIIWEGKRKRLLDELDVIHALSGGTFTGAYYVLNRDQIFHDFEYRFLRKDWETELKERVFKSPSNWFRLWSPYFGRAHLMSELLDEALFDHKTYADLAALHQRPLLIIHASDMATLSRFEFTQFQFDFLCSDLGELPIAYASAASAALPLILSPISLKNYANQCSYEIPAYLEKAKRGGRIGAQRANELLSYTDSQKRPYIHLLDGGLSDNLALRGLIEGSGLSGGFEKLLIAAGVKNIKKFVVISVNAETSPDVVDFRSDHIPVISKAMGSLVDIPINRYSFDTTTLIKMGIDKWRDELRLKPRTPDSPFASDGDIYFIDASLNEVEDPDERIDLMKIPTTLYLTDPQIDKLVLGATKLIRNNKEFQRLMQDIEAPPLEESNIQADKMPLAN
ncbi:lipoprotein [Nitrospira sp. KM1]|uniref:patatin-like phospholipase family protein n=1 Tax=Nitrospira sp. KM1 TaxID=1936990 RepID=UPI0013A71C4B|nr:patatin-like phospholipase family protein [Nitrospira sp. KM1]BCA53069.1 lipoprotein [Nitrospira sp. KM1]